MTRLLPRRPFPSYAYTGDPAQPHPSNDPRGHSYGRRDPEPPPLEPDRWRENEDYLFGIDLFNHGYYWEAHEAWEGLWIAAGKRGAAAEFLKGLIKLTAAGVKVRQGLVEGVRKHAARAVEHFRKVASELEAGEEAGGKCRFAGLSLDGLAALAREIGERAEAWPRCEGEGPAVVFDRALEPGDGEASAPERNCERMRAQRSGDRSPQSTSPDSRTGRSASTGRGGSTPVRGPRRGSS